MNQSAKDQNNLTPPPAGDSIQAEKYISKIVRLVEQEKLTVDHTDLSKFDPSNLQDHYRLDLKEYVLEVSHSKQPDSGKDSYILIFTNIKKFDSDCQKIILAYLHLTAEQFKRFTSTAKVHLEKKQKEAAAKKLQEALSPIDQALDNLAEVSKHENSDSYEIPPRNLAVN